VFPKIDVAHLNGVQRRFAPLSNAGLFHVARST
jgi:hypothetical protein